MRYERSGNESVIQRERIHISCKRRKRLAAFIRNVNSPNDKLFPVFKLNNRLREKRRADRIDRLSGSNRIKTKSAHYVPRRHLAAIFVADQAVGGVLVEVVHYLADVLLRFPRLAGVVVKVGNVMRRLVAVGVLADQAREISLLAACEFLIGRK